jgi:hypothetical protein
MTLIVSVTHARRYLHRLVRRVHDERIEVIILRHRRAGAVLLPCAAAQGHGVLIGTPTTPLAALVSIETYRRWLQAPPDGKEGERGPH